MMQMDVWEADVGSNSIILRTSNNSGTCTLQILTLENLDGCFYVEKLLKDTNSVKTK